ncbi:MAG: zinc-ribbon domain-containing protein [Aerococcaceae bacterium]|nr:zinc-ribbon domain-containing protein [Aerococcaceae bacterium]
MFIVWGSKGYKDFLGQMNTTRTCGRCNNEVRYELIKVGRKFTIFFIPTFSYSNHYYVCCPICQAGIEIEKSDVETYFNA